MGKERVVRTVGCLSVFACWLLAGTIAAQAATFTVNTNVDIADANPGDGVCESAPPNHICTLRAAIQETNALAGTDEIILPPNTIF
jgi:CSLREA domain-containing protein